MLPPVSAALCAPKGADWQLAWRDKNTARFDVRTSNCGDVVWLRWKLFPGAAQFEKVVSVEALLFPVRTHAGNFNLASANHNPRLAIQFDLLTNLHDLVLS
jgi:hypothetical protein